MVQVTRERRLLPGLNLTRLQGRGVVSTAREGASCPGDVQRQIPSGVRAHGMPRREAPMLDESHDPRAWRNKRAGLNAALVFLLMNGWYVSDPGGRLYDAMIAIAVRSLDKAGLAELLQELVKPDEEEEPEAF